MIDFLNTVLFSAFGVPVTLIEVIGFVTGGICVWLVAQQNIWNWPVGILNNIAFLILFFGVGLYADAVLQIIFAVIAIYGWYRWTHGRKNGSGTLVVTYSPWSERIVVLGLTALLTGAVITGLVYGTDSEVPVWDALILTLSLAATYYQAKKRIDSWWVWITVDLISIPLYFERGLLLTSILYFIFLCICVKGLLGWRKSYKSETLAPTANLSFA